MPASHEGMIIREKEPANLETPSRLLLSYLTPAQSFYVRNHFARPDLDATQYRLEIGGAVANSYSLRFDELRSLPAETRTATLECAGNSRVFLTPQKQGAQWELGAVGNAEWTGVPLRILLERAGLRDDVCEIVLEGADRGTPKEPPKPPHPISYARSLPRAKALAEEVLIAYRMNGRELTADHGYPVRAVVPGHYGMASVKWLTKIHAVREPFHGYWQTSDYAYWSEVDGKPVRTALSTMKLKSEIFSPGVYETVPPGEVCTIAGAAWTGDGEVARIDVSTDGGKSWASGEFEDPACSNAWRRWTYRWQTPAQSGAYILLSRATSAAGCVQPAGHDANFGSYVIHHQLPIQVFVG